MGVQGLWKLLEPVGKIVPLEGMAGKVLAIDVSIWLHQAMKGMHDTHGAPIAVAHLLILFHRLCKLLFYQIKPIFVFDGGVPILKQETMAARRKIRSSAKDEAMKIRGKLFKNLLKHEAVRQMLSQGQGIDLMGLSSLALPGSSTEEELYRLPPMAEKENEGSDDEETSEDDAKFTEDIHTIDVTSTDFKNLPPEIRHEILLELIETRKQSSWKYLESMPKESDNFSDFQMGRLLKRRAVQSSLDEVGKEMGGKALSMKELESLLLDRPDALQTEDYLPSRRIAQSEHARFLLIHKNDQEDGGGCAKFETVVKKEPEDEPSTSADALLTEMKEEPEELSQAEIYDLIKKENEVSSQKETKLTGERKINLTDDIKEILPLLNDGKKIGKIQECCFKTDSDQVSDMKDNAIHQDVPESMHVEESVEICDISLTPKKIAEEAVHPIASTETSDTHSISAEEPVSIIVSNATPKEEKENVVEVIQMSDESDDDFVDVDNNSPDTLNITEPIKHIKEQPIQIMIDTEKQSTETDDIFSDIFNDGSKITEESTVQTKDNTTENDQCIEYSKEEEKEEVATVPETLTKEDLKEMKKNVENEVLDLMQEQGRQERLAQNVSEQMTLDAQELLRLFGVPYVVAPMEAEAQCGILNMLGLTDGTITDDSDIWLFGGKVVYKNFFNQKKHVLQYRAEDIEKCFRLSREDLIKIALLVGSDYTPGLEGVGPVTALEILGAFPGPKNGDILAGLKNFREWITCGNDVGSSRKSLRRKIKNAKISPGFPSDAVVRAYLNPEVDDSKEPFSWAKPNVPLLEQYTKRRFGWNQSKCSELITPVMKQINESKKNTTLDKYFTPQSKEPSLEGVLSKRVETALRHMRNEELAIAAADSESEQEKNKRKRPRKEKASVSNVTPSTSAKAKCEQEIPQKRAMEQMFEDRKRTAIKIFKAKKMAKRKTKVVVKEQINLSESSSDSS